MTIEISLGLLIFHAFLLLVMGVVIGYLVVTLASVQDRFDRERKWIRETHLKALIAFADEFSKVLRKSHAWKMTAKKYYNLYKEALDV